MTLALAIIGGGIYAEIVGYFVHILLHSEKIQFLSRSHMLHHLRDYGPKMGLRPSERYIRSSDGRTALFGVGAEWIVPLALVIGGSIAILSIFKVSPLFQLVFLASAIAWGFMLFAYMHDAMHIKGFWMERNPLLKNWFLRARKLHDIHHLNLTDDGRMVTNYGICFFGLDRLLGTLQPRHQRFNERGFEAAQKRYAFIFR